MAKLGNIMSGSAQTGKSATSYTQIPYQNYEYLKSNTWSRSMTGGKTVDHSKGTFFESNSRNMQNRIRKVQERKDMTERQIRFNYKDNSLVRGGGGSSNPVPYGKPPTMDYYKLKAGLQDMTPKLSDTDKQLLLLGVIALLLFLRG